VNHAAHVIAIIKGAVEGDPQKHFGSLLGYSEHLAAAVRAGLVTTDEQPTDEGYEFYSWHNLDQFPAGRANYWHGEALVTACADLPENAVVRVSASSPDPAQEG
jgi:hypothetical protein